MNRGISNFAGKRLQDAQLLRVSLGVAHSASARFYHVRPLTSSQVREGTEGLILVR